MITMKDLEIIKPNSIFARGESIDNPIGINMTNSGMMLRWVAVRGYNKDWSIYVGREEQSYEEIASVGDKLYDIPTIIRLVPCDDEVMNRYRW